MKDSRFRGLLRQALAFAKIVPRSRVEESEAWHEKPEERPHPAEILRRLREIEADRADRRGVLGDVSSSHGRLKGSASMMLGVSYPSPDFAEREAMSSESQCCSAM